jgi:hypothetical protein
MSVFLGHDGFAGATSWHYVEGLEINMREIVHIQAGQCGNQIGARIWEVISDEHGKASINQQLLQ